MEALGYIAGLFTLIGYLPQTFKTIRTKRARDLSLPTFSIICASALLWTAYGLSKNEPAIWITNSVVAICTMAILATGIKSRRAYRR
jgi:MtN3 and saliva related transmembrane protein